MISSLPSVIAQHRLTPFAPSRTGSSAVTTHNLTRHITMWIVLLFLSQPIPMSAGGQEAQSRVRRDPNTMALVHKSVNAMGGETVWSSIRTAVTTGSSSTFDPSISRTFVWTDDWTGQYRMRRDNTNSDGKVSSFLQPSEAATAKTKFQGVAKAPPFQKPVFDRYTALILHLPAAALEIAIQDETYDVQEVSPPKDLHEDAVCIMVSRGEAKFGKSVRVTTCMSPKTFLPLVSYIGLQDIGDQKRYNFEAVKYEYFQAFGVEMVPGRILLEDPVHRVKTITINHITFNPSLPDQEFLGAR
jgi:hypothetical protein